MSKAYIVKVNANVNDGYHTDDWEVAIALTKEAGQTCAAETLENLKQEHANQEEFYGRKFEFAQDTYLDEYDLVPSTLYAVVRQEKHTSDSGNWDSVPMFRAIAHVEHVFRTEEEAVAYVKANEFNWGDTVNPVKEFGFPQHYNNDVEVERFITPITL